MWRDNGHVIEEAQEEEAINRKAGLSRHITALVTWDENAAGEIAALLGYLRLLQRKTGAAIALVHHSRKNLSANGGAGYSLRGSSDLYAWVDSFLYLRRHHGQLMLSAEHRSASGAGPLALELANLESGPYLRLASNTSELATRDPLPDQILALLSQSSEPRTAESLRSSLQVRNQRLVEALRQLSDQRKIVRLPQGYMLPASTLPLTMESSSPRVAPRWNLPAGSGRPEGWGEDPNTADPPSPQPPPEFEIPAGDPFLPPNDSWIGFWAEASRKTNATSAGVLCRRSLFVSTQTTSPSLPIS